MSRSVSASTILRKNRREIPLRVFVCEIQETGYNWDEGFRISHSILAGLKGVVVHVLAFTQEEPLFVRVRKQVSLQVGCRIQDQS